MDTRTKRVVTKKDHQCFGCGQTIPAGRKVEYFTALCDGDFSYGYVCEICEIVLEDHDYYDGYWYEGDLIQDICAWNVAAQKFEERTGASYNTAIIPFCKAKTAPVAQTFVEIRQLLSRGTR